MATMYEMIMDLPLFKGVGKDQVSNFLEKTHVNFHNYNGGDVIVDLDEEVKMVKFVISGEVNIIHSIGDEGLTIEERSGFGRVLGADRLFGMATGYPYKVVASTRASIMEFSKDQYMNLLNSDRIYMLNFFNFLSLRAQRPAESFFRYGRGDIGSRIRQLIFLITDPSAKSVRIDGDNKVIADYCGCDEEAVKEWKQKIHLEIIAECDADSIKINSRSRFLE